MTMSVVDGIMGANLQNKEPSAIVEPSVHEIANAFARQYYQVLCEDPKSAHKFYGHESTLLMNNHSQVSGQEKIGRMLEELIVSEKSNRIKVHNIKGAVLDNNKSIMILVFAEIAGRRFTQTFLMASQGLKKYYIQHDAFMFCDLVFLKKGEEVKSVVSNENSAVEPELVLPKPVVEKTPVAPSAAQVNGHRRSEQPKDENSTVSATPEKPRVYAEHTSNDERAAKRQTPRKEEHTPRKKEEITKPEPVAEPPKPAVPSGPKTWANMVGGGSNAKTSVTIVPQPAARQQPKLQQTTQVNKASPVKPQTQTPAEPATKNNQDRTLFVGGIQRNVTPESAAVVETELKELFSALAEVENVSVPSKSLGKSGDTGGIAFAFVTLKSVADLQKVLALAVKGDRENSYRLPLKVSTFGHDGEVNISEQKNHDRDRYNNNRGRGGFRGGPGGNFRTNRGGRGNARGNAPATAQV